MFFQVEDFGKLSAPVFRIFLDWFRAPATKIRRVSFHFSVFVQFAGRKKYANPILFLIFLKEQVLKPCSDCRSRDLLHGKTNYSLRIVPTILEHAMEVGAVKRLSWE